MTITPRAADQQVELYLTALLGSFGRTDRVYAIRDKEGKPIRTVLEMLAEGDVLLNANSFEREREVHRHIGDYVLFWSGIYPDHLTKGRAGEATWRCTYREQGKASYYLASTFDYDPYRDEAAVLRKLSDGFDEFSEVLRFVGHQMGIRPN